MRKFKIDEELKVNEYKNPESNIRLCFGRHNETYEVINEKVTPLDKVKTFKDAILAGLFPETEKNLLYGASVNRTEPLTKKINRMRETLDNATIARNELIRQKQQEIIDLQNQAKSTIEGGTENVK